MQHENYINGKDEDIFLRSSIIIAIYED